MKNILKLAIAAIVLGALSVTGAAAADDDMPCGNRTKLIASLGAGYQEVGQARGLVSDDKMVEIFASPSGTWTILVSFPDGKSCVLTGGKDWQQWQTTKVGTDT